MYIIHIDFVNTNESEPHHQANYRQLIISPYKEKIIITTNHFILYLRPVVLLNARFKVYVALIDQSIVSFPQFIYQ